MSENTVLHRVVRPAVRLIARTGATPNQITTVRLATALAAAACFARGGEPWIAVGAAVFVLSMLLDRADGELARQTGKATPSGHRYDLICDCTAGTATFFGMGIGLVPDWGPIAAWLGVSAGVGIGALFWQINVWKLVSLRAYALFGGRITVDADDAMIFLPILVWCGQIKPMLVAASLLTPGAALWLSVGAVLAQRRR